MQDIAVEEIRWLWKPYIPFGKITIIQGDGGDGKTTFVLAIAAAISKGIMLPESTEIITPSNEPLANVFLRQSGYGSRFFCVYTIILSADGQFTKEIS